MDYPLFPSGRPPRRPALDRSNRRLIPFLPPPPPPSCVKHTQHGRGCRTSIKATRHAIPRSSSAARKQRAKATRHTHLQEAETRQRAKAARHTHLQEAESQGSRPHTHSRGTPRHHTLPSSLLPRTALPLWALTHLRSAALGSRTLARAHAHIRTCMHAHTYTRARTWRCMRAAVWASESSPARPARRGRPGCCPVEEEAEESEGSEGSEGSEERERWRCGRPSRAGI